MEILSFNKNSAGVADWRKRQTKDIRTRLRTSLKTVLKSSRKKSDVTRWHGRFDPCHPHLR